MTVKQKYLVYLSYIGTNFRGSQIQIDGNINVKPTVQGTVEQAFAKLLGLEGSRPIQCTLSSRTDAGVHALRTAVHVELPPFKRKNFYEPELLQYMLNKLFNKECISIRVLEVFQVPDIFHARYSAIEKVYLYRVGIIKKDFYIENKLLRFIRPITESNRTYFFRADEFDIRKAHKVSQLFVGKKNFGAFISPKKQTSSTVCNIQSISIEAARPFMPSVDVISQRYDYFHFIVKGHRFLYHMVRKMIGVILSVASDVIPFEKAQLLIKEPQFSSWSNKVLLAPGYGLYLVNVTFDPNHLVISEEEKKEKQQLLKENPEIDPRENKSKTVN